MKPDQLKDSELDSILKKAFFSGDQLTIPLGLVDRTVRKIEKKALIRSLVLELLSKIALGLISLAVLAGVFAFIRGTGVLTFIYVHFVDNWQLFSSLLLLSFITIFVDQVGLKFYNSFKEV